METIPGQSSALKQLQKDYEKTKAEYLTQNIFGVVRTLLVMLVLIWGASLLGDYTKHSTPWWEYPWLGTAELMMTACIGTEIWSADKRQNRLSHRRSDLIWLEREERRQVNGIEPVIKEPVKEVDPQLPYPIPGTLNFTYEWFGKEKMLVERKVYNCQWGPGNSKRLKKTYTTYLDVEVVDD